MKRFLFSLLAMGLAFAAKADAMYWQLSAGQIPDYTETARIVAVSTNGDRASGTSLYVGYYDSSAGTMVFDSNHTTGPVEDLITGLFQTSFEVLGSSYTVSAYDFYIELGLGDNGSFTELAYSGPISGSDIASYINTGTLMPPASTLYTSTVAVTVVPEPSSAMMLLVGAAFLVLRRKRT